MCLGPRCSRGRGRSGGGDLTASASAGLPHLPWGEMLLSGKGKEEPGSVAGPPTQVPGEVGGRQQGDARTGRQGWPCLSRPPFM